MFKFDCAAMLFLLLTVALALWGPSWFNSLPHFAVFHLLVARYFFHRTKKEKLDPPDG